jgi:hypothetical protein
MIDSLLDEKVAAAQVARLSILRGFPAEPAARAEVMLALRDWCKRVRIDARGQRQDADAQCKAVIDDAVRTMRGWLGPVELKDIHDDLFPPRQRWGPDGPMEEMDRG